MHALLQAPPLRTAAVDFVLRHYDRVSLTPCYAELRPDLQVRLAEGRIAATAAEYGPPLSPCVCADCDPARPVLRCSRGRACVCPCVGRRRRGGGGALRRP